MTNLGLKKSLRDTKEMELSPTAGGNVKQYPENRTGSFLIYT